MQLKHLMTSLLFAGASLALMQCNQSATTPPVEPAAQTEKTTENTAHDHETGSEDHPEAQTAAQSSSQIEIELPHIHGMGYSADGRQLFVAAHEGLRIFSKGQWLIPDQPAHDYMGYTVTDNGFYSSGHPHPSSGLVNPLGLVKSEDSGQTLTSLGFEGESDFHLMGVGYQNHAIYVLNPAPNSKLAVGMHYSLDEGQTWQQSTLQGVTANPIQITVHPLEANRVALATEGGLLLSDDHGNTFKPVGDSNIVTAVFFTPQGDRLLFGTQTLFTYNLASSQISPVSSPALATDDAIAYITVNPTQADGIALATFKRDLHLSSDGGWSWVQIVQEGKTASEK